MDKIAHRTVIHQKELFTYFTSGQGDPEIFKSTYKRKFNDPYWEKIRTEKVKGIKGGK